MFHGLKGVIHTHQCLKKSMEKENSTRQLQSPVTASNGPVLFKTSNGPVLLRPMIEDRQRLNRLHGMTDR